MPKETKPVTFGKTIVTDGELAKDMLQGWNALSVLIIGIELAWIVFLIKTAHNYGPVQLVLVLVMLLNLLGFFIGPKMQRIKYKKYILASAQVKAITGMKRNPTLDFTGSDASMLDETSYLLGYGAAIDATEKRLAKVAQLQREGEEI